MRVAQSVPLTGSGCLSGAAIMHAAAGSVPARASHSQVSPFRTQPLSGADH